jgi:periplasmic divalent cation tolerance protein
MSDKIVVFVTVGSKEEADKIARALVEERLAACVNVIEGVQSFYRWQGEVCVDPEFMLMIKTTRESLMALSDRVRGLHSYDLPETIALQIVDGSRPYLTWIEENVGPIRPA